MALVTESMLNNTVSADVKGVLRHRTYFQFNFPQCRWWFIGFLNKEMLSIRFTFCWLSFTEMHYNSRFCSESPKRLICLQEIKLNCFPCDGIEVRTIVDSIWLLLVCTNSSIWRSNIEPSSSSSNGQNSINQNYDRLVAVDVVLSDFSFAPNLAWLSKLPRHSPLPTAAPFSSSA